MTLVKKRRSRNPDATITAIFEAALSCLATDGPRGLTLAEVAKRAGVNRGTAYEYFKTRDNLIKETTKWVSEKLFRTVFKDPKSPDWELPENDVIGLTERLANFAMDNPELCRVWLMQVLSLPNPATDPFWNAYQSETARCSKTKVTQQGIDAEVFTAMQLAGAFLWPMTVRARIKEGKGLYEQVHRYVRECVRQALYGSLRPEYFPELIKRLQFPEYKKNLRENNQKVRESNKLTLILKGSRGNRNPAMSNGSRSLTLSLNQEDATMLRRLFDRA